MSREEGRLSMAKRAYENARKEGDRREEARWANIAGDILKSRGEYSEALEWFLIDYNLSINYLPEKDLFPTCQSLGEVYSRLERFQDSLIYQKKHLELAKDRNNLVQEQRASTQLGRTYHEVFLQSDDNHHAVRNAKKYFTSAMKLAQTLKENPPFDKCSFLKEYIDAYNNIGMLEFDLYNLEGAQNYLTKGLQICDEEEVIENDDGRARLHHNLGNVYMELRKWNKAREHIEKDIVICRNLGHCQGEAKGYINLGELHYRVQKFDDANHCYQKALDLAKSVKDEDALVSQINKNTGTVKQAVKVMDELKQEEQNLKKFINMGMSRGTLRERKCLQQLNASLDCLIEKSGMIFAWKKHCYFAKTKKNIVDELCDKEKLADSFLVIGESYHKLRNFNKALKWFTKSWEIYNLIGNSEGQALSKINMGNILDSVGDWAGALDAFDEGYSSIKTFPTSMSKSTSSQGTGRKRVRLIPSNEESEKREVQCPRGRVHKSPQEVVVTSDEFTSRYNLSPVHGSQGISPVMSGCVISSSTHANLEESIGSNKSTSTKLAARDAMDACFPSTNEVVDKSHSGVNNFKCNAGVSGSTYHVHNISSSMSHPCDDEACNHTIFKIEDVFLHVEPGLCKIGDRLSVEDIKVQAACIYYLWLGKRSRGIVSGSDPVCQGLFPNIQHMNCDGKALESLEAIDTVQKYVSGKPWIEVSIDGWVSRRLFELYIECCMELSEPPNLKLLMKLYSLQVTDDVIFVSDCELEDMSGAPLLNAINLLKNFAVVDISHNLFGNETLEKLRKVFMSSSREYSLALDLHCNCFGPTALLQICECPVFYAHLEVLNISGNCLTDGCASYLSTILQNCKALYSLNIERCSITSTTIQKVADSLDSGSVLEQISLGYNNPVSGTTLVNLLEKLATLKRFSELNLNGIKLSTDVVDSLCHLFKTSCLSELMLGETSIGTDQALLLMESRTNKIQELMKLDLSSCGLSSEYIFRLNNNVSLIRDIIELNIGGNHIMLEGAKALASLLRNPHCGLRVLVVCKCQIGIVGVLGILQALAENWYLQELNLAENSLQTDPPSVDASTKVLSTAIRGAKWLQLLDLSNNGFSEQAAEALYAAWSSKSRCNSSTHSHIDHSTVHFSLHGNRCCGTKPCCRRV